MAGMGDGEEGPDTYPAKAPWRRALIIVAGPVANILAAVAILAGVYMFQGEVTDIKPVVQVVEPNSMADGVGMRSGDRIVGFGGERVKTWEEFERQMKDREPGEEVSVTVLRDGSRRTFSGELGADSQNPDRALVGVRPKLEKTTYGVFESVGLAVQRCVEITAQLGAFVGQLVTGEEKFYDNVTGPVGIASVGSTAVQPGFLSAAARPDQPEPRHLQPAADPAARRRAPLLYSGGEADRQARERADDGQDRRRWHRARPGAVPVRDVRGLE
jgi:regulator of sigma E protease